MKRLLTILFLPCICNAQLYLVGPTLVPMIDRCAVIYSAATGGLVCENLIPAQIITISLSACPTGYTEVSALNGVTLVGTIAANGDVGTTGGNNNITPTVNSLTAAAQVFTGSSTVSTSVSAGTPVGSLNTHPSSVFNVSIGATSLVTGLGDHTFTGTAMSTHQHSVVPTGTNQTSSVTGTLNSFDNRSAFLKVIFCSKD